jgi:squalene cyclase
VPDPIDPQRLRRCYATVKDLLLRERVPEGHWVGELSTSALSTATAVMALLQVQKARPSPGVATPGLELIARGLQWLVTHQNADGGWGDTTKSLSNISTTMLCHAVLVAARSSVEGPVSSGSPSDASSSPTHYPLPTTHSITLAAAYIDRAGGVPALIKRYGKDKTFSIPILTHCALAGLVDWRDITPLPFELACLPARFYKTVRLPVVSYALPALIAIGQVRHHFAPTWNPVTRVLRNLSVNKSLRVLERIQPANGGFLEATPLTSFVTMSLAAKGLVDHPVVQKGVEFIVNSVRPDGSWPIDTNLATWVTTLAVNALGDDLPEESRLPILNWLLDQQYKEVHPYTNADPGGWAWTNLPGGVPDADDTAGAMLAVLELSRQLSVVSEQQSAASGQQSDSGDHHGGTEARSVSDSKAPHGEDAQSPAVATAGTASQEPFPPPHSQAPAWERTRREAPLRNADEVLAILDRESRNTAVGWLYGVQNRDGGFPTFCRGWGALPFDRSSPDITSHAVRAIVAFHNRGDWVEGEMIGKDAIVFTAVAPPLVDWQYEDRAGFPQEHLIPLYGAVRRGLAFLDSAQRPDGSWLPLWFGNQHAPDDINPTYGTAKVLAAFRDCGMLDCEPAQRGLEWLRLNQNPDGGWGARPGTPSSVEETSLATEALLDDPLAMSHVACGLAWLMDRVEAGTIADPAPIGFYFAKLWYFERLYPLIFAVSCLRRASGGRQPASAAEA